MLWRTIPLLAAVAAVSAFAAERVVDSLAMVLSAAEEALRAGDVGESRRAFETALRMEPTNVRAHVGLGRLHRAISQRSRALDWFAEAFALDPNDPSAVFEYAASTPGGALASALWARLARLPEAPAEWRDEARSRRALIERLGDRPLNRLSSAYGSYTIPMPVAYSRDSRPLGWMLKVRIGEGRELRLLLDTGSRGILIDGGEAKRLGLEPLADTWLGGFGDAGGVRGQYMLAHRLHVHGLSIENAIVEAAPSRLPADVDGLIGLDTFRQFRMTMDGPRRVLLLEPYAGVDPAGAEGLHPWAGVDAAGLEGESLRLGHLVAVRGELAGNAATFVLDSGAAYSLLQASGPAIALRTVTFEGLSGSLSMRQITRPVKVRIGGHSEVLRDAGAADLTGISGHYGIRVDGFIGFPVLKRLVTSIDLRSGQVAIAEPSRH